MSNDRRTMLAFADSEGAPHRGKGESSLWDFCVVVKYIVSSETFDVVEKCHHTFQFSMPKYMTRSVVKTSLKTHFDAINHLRVEHGCDDICFCFWNAPHDLSVLKYYDLGNISTVDLLAVAKEATANKYKSYSIGSLCRQFGVEMTGNPKIHSGLGDVIRMIKLLPNLNITNTRMLLPYIRRTSDVLTIGKGMTHKCKPKSETKDVEAPTGKLRGDGASNGVESASLRPQVKVGEKLRRGAQPTNSDIARLAIQFARKLKP